MSSSDSFSTGKYNLLYNALRASGQKDGDYTAFNRCMSEARSKGLTWVQGLDYTVKKLSQEQQPLDKQQPSEKR